jgi:hypothetical protein
MHMGKLWSLGLVGWLAVSVGAAAQAGEHRGPTGGAQVSHDLKV